MLYLKGGDFNDELKDCQIPSENVRLTAVADLMKGLVSDKFVLYVPSSEIHSFHQRLLVSKLAASNLSAKSKKSSTSGNDGNKNKNSSNNTNPKRPRPV